MDEVTYYNLHATAAGAGHAAKKEANNYALSLMMVHLHIEHKMGIRDIASRLGVKMIEVKKVICPEKVAPEPHWADVENARKRGKKVVWDFEKKKFYTKPIKA